MPNLPHSARTALVQEWYGIHARDLPWRRPDCSPWGVLVSEVMLQQTPVVRVLHVWEEWLSRWPAPAALAAASQADAVRAWGRLGYPRRAKRLWECAVALTERLAGRVPDERQDLLALPGVGDYTASAVMAFAYGRRATVLDTNVRRVLARAWMGQPLPALTVRASERELADRVVPSTAGEAAEWAAASMELGALVCTARSPRCAECPLAVTCAWLLAGARGLPDAPRRSQVWHGTDRQVRGRIVAELRASSVPIEVTGRAALEDVEPGQLDRCLASLIADGLVRESPISPGLIALA